jgi:hypothetical protein
VSSAFSFVERQMAINMSDLGPSSRKAEIWEGNFEGTKRVCRLEQ